MSATHEVEPGFRHASDATALRSRADADLLAIAERVAPAWKTWLEDWAAAADLSEVGVTAYRAHESDGGTREWFPLGVRTKGSAWLAGGEAHAGRVVHWLLFGELPLGQADASPIAARVQAEACADLKSRLTASVESAPSDVPGHPDAGVWQAWSGAVEVVLTCEDAELHILLDCSCADAVLECANGARVRSSQALLTPIQHALHSREIRLRAMLDSFELDLGSLLELQPGDILPLPHRLDAAITVSNEEGQRLLSGFLGAAHGHRALQLHPVAQASPHKTS